MFGWGWIARLALGGSFVIAIASPINSLPDNNTSANYNAVLVSSASNFTGATFSPLTAPVITPTATGTGVHLTWAPVLLSSGGAVTYTVTRTSSSNTSVQVCTDANVPQLISGLMDCTDSSAPVGDTYTYTEQPFYAPGGISTWSRPVSAPSAPSSPLNLAYLGIGTASTSTNNGTNSVSYPSGSLHDLLIFVSINNTNTKPSITSAGWSSPLVDSGTSTPAAFHMYIAWREAPASSAGTVSYKAGSNGSGASTWVVRYTHPSGGSAAPATATATVNWVSGSASAQFTPSGTITTSSAWATVISIVAVRAANTLSLSTAQGFALHATDTANPGSIGDAIGVVDLSAPLSGSVVGSPTWAQSGTPASWMAATIAFA